MASNDSHIFFSDSNASHTSQGKTSSWLLLFYQHLSTMTLVTLSKSKTSQEISYMMVRLIPSIRRINWCSVRSSPLLLLLSKHYSFLASLHKRPGHSWKRGFLHLQKSCANSEGSNSSQQSISDYLIHAKSIFDLLASAGSNMAKTELVEYAVYSLQHEYKEFTTPLHLRQSLTFDEFFNLPQEKQLQKRMAKQSRLK